MSSFMSATALQHSVSGQTIPKAKKEHLANKISCDTLYAQTEPTFFRSTNGFRKPYFKKKKKHPTPGPSDYVTPSALEIARKKKKGITIVPFRPLTSTKQEHFPGPNKYRIKEKKKVGVKMTFRKGFFYHDLVKQSAHCISPDKYAPDKNIVMSARYGGAGIGYGKRFKKANNGSPGPGAYKIPSIFDKPKHRALTIN